MSDGSGPSKKTLKHRLGWWGSAVACVIAATAVLANFDGTISLAQRAGHVIGIGKPSRTAGATPTSEPLPPSTPATPQLSESTTELSTTPETPAIDPTTEPSATAGETPVPTTVEEPTETPTPPPPTNVYGWYYLADLDPVSTALGQNCTGGCTGFHAGPGSLGRIYPQSYVMRVSKRGSLSTSVWNALHSCTKFDAMVGLDDDSDSTEARFTITPDGGSPVTVATIRTGQPKHVTFSLENVYRFTLGTNLTKPEAGEQKTVWGDAKVYCTANVKPADG